MHFWRKIDIPLINNGINLILTCVITSKTTRNADHNPGVSEIGNPTNATFTIKDTKLYVPVVTLSTEHDDKLLEQLNRI